MPADHHRDGFTISTDPARLDVGAIGDFLQGTTQDAQEFYRQCGFTPVEHPGHYMEKLQSMVSPGMIAGTSEISLGDLNITS